jgi:PAS domain S-box-containing protein
MVSASGPIRVLFVDADSAPVGATRLEDASDRLVVDTATNAPDAADALADGGVDCVVSDGRVAGTDGLELLESVRERRPDLPFVLFPREGSERLAVEAFRAGVADYVERSAGDEAAAERYGELAERVVAAVDRRRTETRRADAFETATVAMAVCEPETATVLDANRAYRDVLGEGLPDLSSTRRAHPAGGAPSTRELLRRAVEEGAARAAWNRATGMGANVRCDVTVAPLPDDGRDRVLLTVHDAATESSAGQSDAVLSTVLENLPVGILVEDSSRTIVAVNSALYDLFGLPGSGDDLLGLDCGEAAKATRGFLAEPEGFVERIDDLIDRREPVSGEELELADGRVLERSYVPYTLPAGEANLWLYRDVTDRKRRERELTRERDRLDEFASLLSHDLRNPLGVAAGKLDLARADCDSAHLDDVETALDRMTTLVENVLALARQGAAVDEVKPIDFASTARSCWVTVETADANLRTGDSAEIFADDRRLRRLLENLFRNSVEHGGASVTVTVEALDDGFYVADDGPGIPPGDRDVVFDPGYSTDSGTGFGLSIVRDIVDAHGWEVAVTESEDGGARFEITDVHLR